MRIDEESVRAICQRLRDWGHDIDGFVEQDLVDEFDVMEQPDQNQIGGFRSGDPDTSRKGAVDAYPRSGNQRHRALIAIASAGSRGMTYAEVANATGINGVWKRLSELHQGGWIQTDGRERIVKETGSFADVYSITSKARDWIERKEGVLVS